ncbi:MAG: CNP1-like family protein [Gammaproteobacteria bacterium]|jgi:hypothetical protein|nr:CNP1-like family protein [Gammaproteobacteria bacterium]MBU0785684.1 CNP1-like family protein [Gammaproteobacteria bacterium]MBU0813804.1 CNP1-like family protein [Gammaproteobacteria bacterium]MBU1788724.1 CNP1-like family protein [Gammaproteobacteria bacterium]
MQIKHLILSGLMLAVACAFAQADDEDAPWKESAVPPPPAIGKNTPIPLEMPPYVSLRYGVDPDSLSISKEGVVRYVMIATNPSGAMNAMYEGIRCATGEVRTYAVYGASGKWVDVKDSKWRGMNDNLPSKHALALARQGACVDRYSPASSPAAIIRELKYPGSSRIQ